MTEITIIILRIIKIETRENLEKKSKILFCIFAFGNLIADYLLHNKLRHNWEFFYFKKRRNV